MRRECVGERGDQRPVLGIGDQVTNEQEGADGSNKQRNRAHFIELAAALSIVDFADLRDDELHVTGGVATDPKFYEFGIQNRVGVYPFWRSG